MKQTAIICSLLMTFLCIHIMSCPAMAGTGEPIATVVAVRGKVSASDAKGQSRSLAIKDTLFREDTLNTGKSGRIQILFKDSTIISLGRKTTMKIAEYEWSAKEQSGTMKTEVNEGTFRVMGGAITKFAPQNFSTETPTATIGIRGSMYAGTVTPISLSVLFQGGKGIDIINQFGSVAITRPGFGTHVMSPDQPPLPPVKFVADDLAAINNELTGEINEQEDQTPTTEDEDTQPQKDQSTEPSANEEAPPDDQADQPPADGEPGAPVTEGQAPEENDQAPPPDDDQQLQADKDQAVQPDDGAPLADNNQQVDDGQPAPAGNEQPTEDQPIMITDGQALATPEGTEPLEGAPQITENIEPATESAMPPPPEGDIAIMPEGDIAPMPDGTIPTPPEGDYIYLPEGDLAFIPEGDMLALTPETAPPPPDGQDYSDGALLQPDGAVYPDGTLPPPTDGGLSPDAPISQDGMLPPPDEPIINDPYVTPISNQPIYEDPMLNDPTLYEPVIVPIDPGTIYDPTTDPSNQSIAAGDPTATPTSMPSDGVDGYAGNLVLSDTGEVKSALMEINWRAGTGFGIVFDTLTNKAPVFFFGQVNGTSLTNIKLFGTDGPVALEASGSGEFKGLDHQYFDMNISGFDYDLTIPGTPAIGSGWNALTTTGITPRDPIDNTAPSGSENWQGYVVAISENVHDLSQRKLFMNSFDSGFHLTLDKDNGTVTGDILAPQLNPAVNTAAEIDVHLGGSGKSAYILNDHFGAIIDSATSAVEDDNISATINPLNAHGNYLTTEDPDKIGSDFMSWGYWEISHSEAGGTEMWHTHIPYTMWIAGSKTPTSYISGLLSGTPAFVGHYSGFAQASRVTGTGIQYVQGTTNLTFDFANAGTADAITGNIDLGSVNLAVGSPASSGISPFAFHGHFTNPGLINSELNGNFYGPQANAVGGNFNAEFSTEQYMGIFGAKLTNGPPP